MGNTVLGALLSAILITRQPEMPAPKTLAAVSYSLTNRYSNEFVNGVFTDNILLTLAYMSGKAKKGESVDWNEVKKPGTATVLLPPGKTFAFHDGVDEKYRDKVQMTTNAHFGSNEGFKSDGWLVGDGVCHLASFLHAASMEAGLDSVAPTRHDFAAIPEVPKELGVSIFYTPDDPATSRLQNLYITNNRDKTVAFVFTNKGDSLDIAVREMN